MLNLTIDPFTEIADDYTRANSRILDRMQQTNRENDRLKKETARTHQQLNRDISVAALRQLNASQYL